MSSASSPPPTDMQRYLDQPSNKKILKVSYKKKDLLTYAIAIGCQDERFIHAKNPNFSMFPTYPVSLFFKGDSDDAHEMRKHPIVLTMDNPFPSKPYGITTGLDGERYIERVRDLPIDGGEFLWRHEHTAITRKTDTLVLAEYETTMEDMDGNVYYKFWSSQASM